MLEACSKSSASLRVQVQRLGCVSPRVAHVRHIDREVTLTKVSAVWFPVMAARLVTALAAASVASSVLASWKILGDQAPARHSWQALTD